MSASWSGMGLLQQIDGSNEEYPPIRVLFALYRLKASGRLSIQHSSSAFVLTLQSGKVVGLIGAPELLSACGVSGSEDADLMALIGAAIASGTSPDEAMLAAANGLGDLLANSIDLSGGQVRFEDGIKPSGAAIPLPLSIPRIIRGGLERTRPVAVLEAALAEKLSCEIRLSLPDDTTLDRWELTPVSLRLLRIIKKNADRKPTLGMVIRKDPIERMVAVDLLLQLGLVSLFEAPARARRPRKKPAAAPEPTVAGPLETLTAELKQLQGLKPWEVLGLRQSTEISDEGIDRANRTASRKYHPDQFSAEPEPVRAIAAECFAILQDAYGAMRSATLREEVSARLEAAENGEQYVTDRDRTEAELLYSKAQLSFRKKDYTAAHDGFDRALRLNPGKWRYAYMARRSGYHTGVLSGAETAQLILDIDGPRGLARADVLFEVAEILMKEKEEARAHELYKQVLQLNPEHIGARRWGRIRKMRKSAADDESNGSLFSGLFRRKKK